MPIPWSLHHLKLKDDPCVISIEVLVCLFPPKSPSASRTVFRLDKGRAKSSKAECPLTWKIMGIILRHDSLALKSNI